MTGDRSVQEEAGTSEVGVCLCNLRVLWIQNLQTPSYKDKKPDEQQATLLRNTIKLNTTILFSAFQLWHVFPQCAQILNIQVYT